MDFINIVILAIIQGITEFLPISSSGHLLLASNWVHQGLTTDVMVHVGSFFAVLVYFWRDVLRIIKGGFQLLVFKWTAESRLAAFLLIATLPVIAFGLALEKSGFLESIRKDVPLMLKIVGWTAIGYGLLLYIADKVGPQIRKMDNMTFIPALLIGCAQALSLIPGTSRSGITITAGRFLGFERIEAARFSFLLGIPAIGGAGLKKAVDVYKDGQTIPLTDFYAAGLTFIVALLAIAFLMALVKRFSLLPFTIYRVVLGVVLLAFGYQFLDYSWLIKAVP